MNKELLNSLESLPSLKQIPRNELQWLVLHGNIEIFQPGLIASKGSRIENLWIILKGHISVHIDRGAGPKVVNKELNTGSVTGMLPFSRLLDSPGDVYADERTEIFAISVKHFPEMINICPLFTAHTVHTMIDRARIHNTSAMQDEKMISIGRLSAGLAHELNNPASVAIRDAKLLRENQANAEYALRILSKAGLNDMQFKEIENLRSRCIEIPQKAPLLPIQKYDLQDKITGWLEQNQIDTRHAGQLAELAVTTEDLDKLQTALPGGVFEPALKWIVASCSIDSLTVEIEQSTNKIYKLV
jgi:CRP-like cAMP-binding protein